MALREVYNAIESRATPVVEAVVRSDQFGEAASLVARARRSVGKRAVAASADVLHLMNLPAGSDVKRLRRQLGELDYEVRQLRMELAARDTEPRDARRKKDHDGADS